MSTILQFPLNSTQNHACFIGLVTEVNDSFQPIKVKHLKTHVAHMIDKINPLLGTIDYGSEVLCMLSETGLVAVCQCAPLSNTHPKIIINDSQLTFQQGETAIKLTNNKTEFMSYELMVSCMSVIQLQAFATLVNCSSDFVDDYRKKIQEQVNEDGTSAKSIGY